MDRRALLTLTGGALAGAAFVSPTQDSVAAADGTVLTPAALEPGRERLRDRAAFARKLERVKVGMRRDEVRKLLGDPDDVWSGDEMHASRNDFVYREGREAWAYGSDGHLAFPTLGRVSIDGSGRVVEVLGLGERLPGPALPPEPETRRLLRLIQRLRRYDKSNDPLRVIQVVNGLFPLGKRGALAVIDEYLRVSEDFEEAREGLFVVVRSLFDVPDPPGYLPAMEVGAPSPRPPKDLRRSPRFPVVLYRDIPFVGIHGYTLVGDPERIEWHLKSYRETGLLRAQPLRPPDNPLEIIDALVTAAEWPDWGDQRAFGKAVAREQALRLVDGAYHVEPEDYDTRLKGSYTKQEPQWQTHLQRFSAVKARWSADLNTYVRQDGTFSPPLPDRISVPRTWRAHLAGGAVQVALRRRSSRSVDISTAGYGWKSSMPLLRIFIGGTEVKTGWDQHIPAQGGAMTGFRAPEGSDIRLILEGNGKVLAETTLRP